MKFARRQFLHLAAGAAAAPAAPHVAKQVASLEVAVWGSGQRAVLVALHSDYDSLAGQG
jgi:hypothetical protein